MSFKRFKNIKFSQAQLSADSSSTEMFYCLPSARPQKIPEWIVLVRESFCKQYLF